MVHLTRGSAAALPTSHALEAVTAAAFGQRRKMLRQSLKSLTPDPTALIGAAGLEETPAPRTCRWKAMWLWPMPSTT